VAEDLLSPPTKPAASQCDSELYSWNLAGGVDSLRMLPSFGSDTAKTPRLILITCGLWKSLRKKAPPRRGAFPKALDFGLAGLAMQPVSILMMIAAASRSARRESPRQQFEFT